MLIFQPFAMAQYDIGSRVRTHKSCSDGRGSLNVGLAPKNNAALPRIDAICQFLRIALQHNGRRSKTFPVTIERTGDAGRSPRVFQDKSRGGIAHAFRADLLVTRRMLGLPWLARSAC